MVFIDQVDRHKKLVLQVLLAFSISGSLVFSGLNFYRGLVLLSTVEAVTGIVSLMIFLRVRKTQDNQHLKRLALSYVVVFFSVMMFAFATRGVSVTIFVWSLAIPSVAYLLLGVRTGFWVTLCFLSISTVLYFGRSSSSPALIETIAYANVVMCAMLLWGLSHTYELTNQRAKNKLRTLAFNDYLTGLFNRSVLSQVYEQKLLESIESQQSLCMFLFDLDRFKIINDEFGHAVGDEVLQEFAALLSNHCDSTGAAFRIGGEEFVLLLPCAQESDAQQLAELIRSQTERIAIAQVPSLNVSVSIGMAVANQAGHTLDITLKKADDRMYLAKKKGRNKVVHQN